MNNASIDEINNFLIEVKELITSNKVQFIPRPKNNLTELGINLKIALDIIMKLTYKDYYNGPKKDNNPGFVGFVWEFGRDELKYQIYIKLKIKDTSRGDLLLIMSFHKAEFPINYTYK